jgi:EAL domain-containing protein (putative c-di-GMP-specific phosphodiesterase class I)
LNIACAQLRCWRDGLSDIGLTLTVNVAHRQFYHPELIDQIKKVLDTQMVNPEQLMFEVAETTLNENLTVAVGVLERLAALNVRIAVDNFGTVLAPLNYLVDLPVDMVKMSPALTGAVARGERAQAVVAALLRLGQALDVQVVAQGIERNDQLDALCRMGCEFGQGNLLSYALDPSRATALAAQGYWVFAAGA